MSLQKTLEYNKVVEDILTHEEFLKLQRRFRHMFKPGNEWMIEDLQKEIDKKWDYLEMMEKITNEN